MWKEDVVKTPGPSFNCKPNGFKISFKPLVAKRRNKEKKNINETDSLEVKKIHEAVIENDHFKICEKFGQWLKSERDLRLHNTKHIHLDPSSTAATGTKRDSSQLLKEGSTSPIRTKVRAVEVKYVEPKAIIENKKRH